MNRANEARAPTVAERNAMEAHSRKSSGAKRSNSVSIILLCRSQQQSVVSILRICCLDDPVLHPAGNRYLVRELLLGLHYGVVDLVIRPHLDDHIKVLPEPGPATINSGPSVERIASDCWSLARPPRWCSDRATPQASQLPRRSSKQARRPHMMNGQIQKAQNLLLRARHFDPLAGLRSP